MRADVTCTAAMRTSPWRRFAELAWFTVQFKSGVSTLGVCTVPDLIHGKNSLPPHTPPPPSLLALTSASNVHIYTVAAKLYIPCTLTRWVPGGKGEGRGGGGG